MPSFYTYAPRQIRDLPFNLKRSQLYPTNPPLVEQGIQDAMAGRRADGYLPQKMMFTRYKNGPAAKHIASSAIGVWRAAAIYQDKVGAIADPIWAGKGVYTPAMAGNDLNRLPQPMQNWYANDTPVARNLLQRPIVQAGNLNEFAAANQGIPNDNPMGYTDEESLLSNALPPNRTPLGHVRKPRRTPRSMRTLKGLGRLGGGLGREIPADGSQNPWTWVYVASGLAGTGLGAYHGYKRNNSVGWGIGWALLGGMFPIIVIPLAFAQGVGKRKR